MSNNRLICIFLILILGLIFWDAYFPKQQINFTLGIPCPMKIFFKIPCPLCGLSSSLVATAQGNLKAALQFHLYGPVLFLLLVGQVIYRAALIIKIWKKDPLPKTFWNCFWIASLLIIMIQWFWHLGS